MFRYVLGIFQAWTLEHNIDGYATLDGPSEETEPRWASDELDIRVFADANNNRSLWKKDESSLGWATNQTSKHENVQIQVVREQGGHPGLQLPAAVFKNPHKSGHVWWGLHSLYDLLGLTSKKTKGRWVDNRKKTLVQMGESLDLGDSVHI